MSMTLDLLNQRRIERQHKSNYNTKKVESEIRIELQEKLDKYLFDNEKVMIEVNPNFVSEFINILTDSVLQIYDYEQIDSNKFVFRNKELVF